ncbi:TPA: hypothetical protein DDW35_02490 [Candidatus Sumerlaeota bacterium]|jgi:hypothetical protein|nr:hypothetical protein [Candidatus Sumerlaeota bacterium]
MALFAPIKNWFVLNTFGVALNAFIKKRSLTLLEKKELDRLLTQLEAGVALQRARAKHQSEPHPESPHCAEAIVFSKDRALQLHALLSSFQELLTPPIPIHVLYYASTPEHGKAYKDVKTLFPTVRFIAQSSGAFRDDLLNIFPTITAQRLFFLVDDIVFTGKTDLQEFCQYDTDAYVPSLRMGKNITRSYTMQQDLSVPPLREETDHLFWQWEKGVHDWGYPLSVDGHIFATWEIAAITQLVSFKAPNSYEDALQLFKPFFACRAGIASPKSRLVNIACNKVQGEVDNIHGEMHQDFLLEQWQKGLQMDYHALAGFQNDAPHADIPLHFIPRVRQNGENNV